MPGHDRDGHQVDERDEVDELRQRLQHVVDRAQDLRHDASSPPPTTPSPNPIATVSTVATSTCDAVSIAEAHSPMNADQREHEEGRDRRSGSPLTTNAMSVMPTSITGQGVSTRKFRNGTSPYWTMWSPIQLVTLKRNVSGFWT